MTDHRRRMWLLAAFVAIAVALTAVIAAGTEAGCNTRACVKRVHVKRDLRLIRHYTPYRCSFGRAAIPCAVVECESRGRWDAYNRSGAAGRYQLMPVHGRPWPARTVHARLEHHRIASRLWDGGAGASHWVCS